jgi:hypothetical protein
MLSEDVKARLRERLDQVHEWPSVYMFKFICEPDQARIDRITAMFPPEVEVLRRYSSGGRFVSFTVREVMMNAEDVVSRYVRASEIEGLIVL